MSDQASGSPTTNTPAAAPGPHHHLLDVFVGTWHATVTLWMQPEAPPQVSEGTMVNQWVLGSRFLEQRYEGGLFGATFQGRGFWGYHNGAQRYEGFWIDSASTVMQTEHGSYDAATRTFKMEGGFPNPTTGAPMSRRTIIAIVSDDEHRMEMFMPGPDGVPAKVMEITYRRVLDD